MIALHTAADLDACLRTPSAYCQLLDDSVLLVTSTLHMAAGATLDCNRRALILPATGQPGVLVNGAAGATIENCRFSSGSTDPHCLAPTQDADLLGCPDDIAVRGRSSVVIRNNTFVGPGLDKFVVLWKYAGDPAEPSAVIAHNRFRDNWYGVLAGADESGPLPTDRGHVDYWGNYSLRIFKRTLRINAGYTAAVWNNLVDRYGGQTGCDATQRPPSGYGWAFSAHGGATMHLDANEFLPGPPPACQDPLNDRSTALDKAPLGWGAGLILSRANNLALPGLVLTLGNVVTITQTLPASTIDAPLTAAQVAADIRAHAGEPR